MADTAALVVALSAQLTKFEKDMNSANKIAERGVRDIEKTFAALNPGAGLERLATGLKAVLGVAVIKELVQPIIDVIDKLGDIGETAERIGITTAALQTLQITLEENGGKAEDATTALQRFSDALGDAAAGSTYLGKLLEKNGVALKDQEGNIRSLDLLLGDFARLVAGAGTSQEKMSLVTEAFGRRAGPQMLLTLNQIAEQGLPAMIAAAEDAGSIIDAEMIKKADEFSDAWKRASRNVFVAFSEVVVKGINAAKIALTEFFELLQSISGFELIPPKVPEAKGEKGPLKITVPGTTRIPAKGGKDPIESQIDAIKKHTALLDAQTQAVGQSAGAQERLRVEAALTQAVLANDRSPEQYAERIKEIGAAAEEAANRLAAKQFAFNEMISSSRDLGNALSEAFKGATLEGRKFDEILNTLVQRLSSRAIDKLFDLAFAPQGAQSNSLFGQLLNQITGKASGGPVRKDQPYVVGEKGPELFVPKQNGMIVPSQVTKSGSTIGGDKNMNITVDVTGANGDAAIEAAVNRGVQRAVQQSVSIVNSTAPGRQMRYSQLGT